MKLALLVFLAAALIGCSSAPPAVPAAPEQKLVVSGLPTESKAGPQGEEMIDKIDLPLYPGSTVKGSTIESGARIPKDEQRYHVQLETKDPVEKVVAFYKGKGEMLDSMSGGKGQVMGMTPKGNRTIIVAVPHDGVTTISISSIAYAAKK